MTTPLLRWVGSKRRLAPTIGPRLLSALAGGGRYYEPFAGSLALFLWLRGEGWRGAATLSDACEPLIGMYRAVHRGGAVVETIAREAAQLDADAARVGAEAVYDSAKALFNEHLPGKPGYRPACPYQAARFLFLNRRCFNGLWRQGPGGEFNVAWGGPERKTAMPSAEELAAFAGALEGATLLTSDFASVLNEVDAGDVVYADPPYNGTYTGYSAPFGPRDQERLAAALKGAVARGATVVASNADTEYVRALYSSWATVEEIELTYLVGGRKGRRPEAKELLITAGGGA
jgi:DNA adenine methylase